MRCVIVKRAQLGSAQHDQPQPPANSVGELPATPQRDLRARPDRSDASACQGRISYAPLSGSTCSFQIRS
ncbi:hypothetical protein PJI17_20480 [Mycobacterium kansasii]